MNKKAILVISFGTSYRETCEKTIGATEKALAAAFPECEVRRAFTSQMIINKLKKRDGIHVDTVSGAAQKLVHEGYETLIAQPLHVINGEEFHDILQQLAPYSDQFPQLLIGSPLLTDRADYQKLIRAVSSFLPALGEGEAVVLMGHGSSHPANAAYAALDYTFKQEGFPHIHIGTVEGSPSLDEVMVNLEKDGVEKVTLMPLMVVAGDHARNDMAGDDEDSWKSILTAAGYQVEVLMVGMGELDSIHQIYIEHARSSERPRICD